MGTRPPMSWLPVYLLYFFLGAFAIALLLTPVQFGWLAFQVRPLQRHYRKLQGKHAVLPIAVRQSKKYQRFLYQILELQNARARALVGMAIILVVAMLVSLLRDFNWPALPQDLEAMNHWWSAIGTHLARALERIALTWKLVFLATAVIGSMVLGILAEFLLGDVLGGLWLFMLGKIRKVQREMPGKAEPSAGYASADAGESPPGITNYYAELGLPTSGEPAELVRDLAAIEKLWQRRVALPGRSAEAKRQLALIEEAREVLLDHAKRRDYDRALGLRGGTV
ncbi:MAG: hypothetical protein HY692_03055 [Cyanobacteria bacterium NC_groundwater_1444_Ag_S-0.65um_54_12]|nr:hypothetical protein [Cyanobacteria bacterium NC_groundwater_1444_Ag_S-0.65um_54_12]